MGSDEPDANGASPHMDLSDRGWSNEGAGVPHGARRGLESEGLREPAAVAFAAECLGWGERERLAARLLAAGPAAVGDDELLLLLLHYAYVTDPAAGRSDPEHAARELAGRLLGDLGGLGAVLAAHPARLREAAGAPLPSAAAALFKAVSVAIQRALHERVRKHPVLGSSQALLDYLRAALAHETAEQLRLLFLDRGNALIRDEVHQRGTIGHAPLYPREVVKRCLELGASAVILAHNHPSGDPRPSRADVEATLRVANALATVEVVLHDHVIVGRAGHASFRSLGLL